jgi:orotidine-5'-phosphate decarboxylase
VLKSQHKHVFLDMKLLDIGNTVERAVANATEFGVDFLTVHGHDLKTMRAAVAGRGAAKTKLLAVTVLTSLTADDLQQQGSSLSPADLVLRRAKLARESGFDGVIASGQEAGRIREAIGPGFLIVTPGIRLTGSATDDQERVATPGRAIAAGADYIVVGRPITQADDPRMIAENFINHIREAETPAGKPS